MVPSRFEQKARTVIFLNDFTETELELALDCELPELLLPSDPLLLLELEFEDD